MNMIPLDKVDWKKVKILKINTDGPAEIHPYEYEFVLPYPLNDWDVFDYWEKERFHSMRDNLTKSDILFDIGTEQGWCNLIYAQFVGPENMVLIEPTPEFWPNIMHTWNMNYNKAPRGFYDGLFSDKTTDSRQYSRHWPEPQSSGDLIDRNSYKYIHEHGDVIPQITIDDYVERSGIVPTALTMDTEGAEILILRGAEKTLRENDVLVWASLHPELAIAAGYGDVQNVHDFMAKLGYTGEFLASDHEDHWLFRKTK